MHLGIEQILGDCWLGGGMCSTERAFKCVFSLCTLFGCRLLASLWFVCSETVYTGTAAEWRCDTSARFCHIMATR